VFISNVDFLKLASINIIVVPLPVIIFALVWFFAYLFQKYIPFSISIYTVGDDPEVAFLCGIKIRPVLIFVYSLSGLLTGLAGAILASRVASGEPAAGVGYEFSAIAAAVIGGTSLFGGTGGVQKTVVGLLIIGVINNGMNMLNIASYFQQIVLGIIIILAVLFDGFRQGKLKNK
jgi:ribose/xylose/arabinose/galactoside ABC-type transport system permease subunit